MLITEASPKTAGTEWATSAIDGDPTIWCRLQDIDGVIFVPSANSDIANA